MRAILCTACGSVGEPTSGACERCGSRDVMPADAPSARKFIEARNARRGEKAAAEPVSARAQATGKVLGRTLGKLFGK